MDKSDLEIEKEADNLEKQAKEEIKNRNYNHAIVLLKKAKSLNAQLGYTGQIGIIEKKIARVKNLIKFESSKDEGGPDRDNAIMEKEGDRLINTAKKHELDKNYKQALKFYKEAFSVFEKLNYRFQCDKIQEEIKSIKEKVEPKPPKISKKSEIEAQRYGSQEKESEGYLSIEQQKQKELEAKRERLKKFKERKERENKLFKEAEELLDKGNHCIKNQEFEDAKFFYEKSMEIFKELGWQNQVKILEKEISNIEKYREELQNKQEEQTIKSKEIDEQVKKISAHDREEKLQKPTSDYLKTIDDQVEPERKRILEEAEMRRKKLRLRAEKSIKKQKEEEYSQSLMTEMEKKRKKVEEKQLQESKKQEEKKTKEEFLLDQANRKLDQAKGLVDNKEFENAKSLYREAIDIFKTLGWFNQVDVLYEEIKNIERYKMQHLAKLREQEKLKKKEEEQFQKRVKEIMSEKEKEKKQRLAQMKNLPPALQKDLQKAKLLLSKAEKEKTMGKLQRVKGRYDYVLKIYRSIPKEKLDLSNDITELEKKISQIESKM